MDFTPDNEQKALRDAVHDMLRRTTPSDAIGAAEHDTAQWQQFVEMGLVALPFEEGAGPVEVLLVAEELGRARVRSPYVDVLLAGHVLAQTGQHDLLAQVGDGSALVVPALYESGRAWGAPPLTTVSSEGVLTGHKDPVPYAEVATHVVVNTDAGLFLVEKPTVDRSRIDWTPTKPRC